MAKSGPKRGKRTDSKKAQTALRKAAIEVLAEMGYAATSAREVADRAGLASGGVFYHFNTMDNFLVEVYRQLTAARLSRLEEALNNDDNWTDTLDSFLESEMGTEEGRAIVELLVASTSSPALKEATVELYDQAVSFTDRHLGQLFEDSPVQSILPTESIAELIVSGFFGIEMFASLDRGIDHTALVNVVRLLDQAATSTDWTKRQQPTESN